MKIQIYNGINIQYPISQLIVEGRKIVETRTYPIPKHYINQELALVETPGKEGKFKSRVIAIIKFEDSYKYESKEKFYSETKLHCVTPDSPWAWSSPKGKWGWPVTVCYVLKTPQPLTKRSGIKFTKNIKVKL